MKQAFLLFGCAAILFSSCKNTTTGNGQTGNSDTTKVPVAVTIPHPVLPTAKGTPRILFVGNSHTEFFVSMPILFGELCTFNKQPVNIDKLVTMAVDINEVYTDHQSEADAKFNKTDADSNYYEMVVLQEKTPVAFQDLEKYKSNVKMIVDKIRKNSPGAAIYIYEGMSFVPYEGDGKEYDKYHQIMKDNAIAAMKECGNAGLFRVGDAVKDAYEGKEGYVHESNGKDNLRFGSSTLHLVNDGGFLETVLLYATIFNQKPQIPADMTFSTGTGDDDKMKKMAVAAAVSNVNALATIAFQNK